MWSANLQTSRNLSSNALKLLFFLLNGKMQTLSYSQKETKLWETSKLWEILMFKEMFHILIKNKFISPNHPFLNG